MTRKSRYTCMESVLMTTPPAFCASARASADLPLAVGPAISTALLLCPCELTQMSLVATLICNPADPALDSTLVDGARAILPSPGPAHWLFDAAGGTELVATMRAHGAYTCLISGGFTLFTSAVAAMLGFDEHRANELMVEDGKLTGEVKEPILGRAAKLATLVELTESFDLDDIDTLAVGDGANDLDMIQAAGLGVAYHAKPAVAAAAAARIDRRRQQIRAGAPPRTLRCLPLTGISCYVLLNEP